MVRVVAVETGYLKGEWVQGTCWQHLARLMRRAAITGAFGARMLHVRDAIDAFYGVPPDAERDDLEIPEAAPPP